jgi:hypothetical protein
MSRLFFDEGVEQLLAGLPKTGFLFPRLALTDLPPSEHGY